MTTTSLTTNTDTLADDVHDLMRRWGHASMHLSCDPRPDGTVVVVVTVPNGTVPNENPAPSPWVAVVDEVRADNGTLRTQLADRTAERDQAQSLHQSLEDRAVAAEAALVEARAALTAEQRVTAALAARQGQGS